MIGPRYVWGIACGVMLIVSATAVVQTRFVDDATDQQLRKLVAR